MLDNEIFVGRKPAINYILALETIMPKSDKIIINSRGQSISKAVDVSQLFLRKFNGFGILNIETGTISYNIPTEYGDKYKNTSTISITINKTNMRDGL